MPPSRARANAFQALGAGIGDFGRTLLQVALQKRAEEADQARYDQSVALRQQERAEDRAYTERQGALANERQGIVTSPSMTVPDLSFTPPENPLAPEPRSMGTALMDAAKRSTGPDTLMSPTFNERFVGGSPMYDPSRDIELQATKARQAALREPDTARVSWQGVTRDVPPDKAIDVAKELRAGLPEERDPYDELSRANQAELLAGRRRDMAIERIQAAARSGMGASDVIKRVGRENLGGLSDMEIVGIWKDAYEASNRPAAGEGFSVQGRRYTDLGEALGAYGQFREAGRAPDSGFSLDKAFRILEGDSTGTGGGSGGGPGPAGRGSADTRQVISADQADYLRAMGMSDDQINARYVVRR